MAKHAPSAPALTFHDTTFHPVTREGQPWLTATEIAQALGYSRSDTVSRLYRQHADEFTGHMTAVVSGNTESVFPVEQRIFSLRGAHLLGMFARTARAAEFRHWVLDILDRETAAPKAAATLPAVHAPLIDAQLQARIDRRAWTLAQAAYEDYRAQITAEVERWPGNPELANVDNWKPRAGRPEVLSQIGAAALSLRVMADAVCKEGERLAKLVGDDFGSYDQVIRGKA